MTIASLSASAARPSRKICRVGPETRWISWNAGAMKLSPDHRNSFLCSRHIAAKDDVKMQGTEKRRTIDCTLNDFQGLVNDIYFPFFMGYSEKA
jgi:hypothetical protein